MSSKIISFYTEEFMETEFAMSPIKTGNEGLNQLILSSTLDWHLEIYIMHPEEKKKEYLKIN